MSFENYEGTALDIESLSTDIQPNDEPEVEDTQTDESVDVTAATITDDNEGTESSDVDDDSTVNKTPDTYNIDGIGDVTAKEIYEWKQGSLRQSDYTKKTTELARQREELKDAKELYDYLTANPYLLEALRDAENNPNPSIVYPTADNQMLRQIAYNQKAMETEMKLNELKSKYGDVDEVALFEKATEMGTDDLEFVYKALSYDRGNYDTRLAVEQAKRELRAELEANKSNVSTMVTNKNNAPPKVSILSPEEEKMAKVFGMSAEEYVKYRT